MLQSMGSQRVGHDLATEQQIRKTNIVYKAHIWNLKNSTNQPIYREEMEMKT